MSSFLWSSPKPIAGFLRRSVYCRIDMGTAGPRRNQGSHPGGGPGAAPQAMALPWPPAPLYAQDHLNRAWDRRICHPPGVQTDFKKLQLNGSSRDYRAILTIIKWFLCEWAKHAFPRLAEKVPQTCKFKGNLINTCTCWGICLTDRPHVSPSQRHQCG